MHFPPRGDPKSTLHAVMASAGLADAYYVAYQSAAQAHDAAHQLPFTLQVALTRRRRPVRRGAVAVRYIQMAPRQLFGIEERHYQGVPLRVSDRLRTAIDLVDRPALGGGIEEVARTVGRLLEEADGGWLVEYVRVFGCQSLAQRLGYLIETLELDIGGEVSDALGQMRGPHVVLLEPGGASVGQIDRRWRVRVNADLIEIEW